MNRQKQAFKKESFYEKHTGVYLRHIYNLVHLRIDGKCGDIYSDEINQQQ
jgi:hypothetical protein